MSSAIPQNQSPLVDAASSIMGVPNLPRAACAGHPQADLFTAENPNSAKAYKIAKAICAGCPEQAPCRQYALANKCEGVWGGLTERERSALNKGQKLPNPVKENRRITELELLRSKRTAAEIAAVLGCTERTVYRKRKQLKAASAVAIQIRPRPKLAKGSSAHYELVS